ncbi:heat domain-containing protein [Rivularia sp. IAM M-261]|nr:heat domain-containing protein [Calothrix sp. PCC 7716]GJD15687.1 heat domain-containing protein [Rivularia sp. IAM M-261]
MNIYEIETKLNDSDFQHRLKAISALKDYDPGVAVTLLVSKLHDPEFLVRSFVAMGLGKQKTPESFAALLEIMKFDNTPNVRAEAANSLSLFGTVAASHLVVTFHQDEHWLVRRSILAALVEMNCPYELFEVCNQAVNDEDPNVQESAVDALASLNGTAQEAPALKLLLKLVNASSERLRTKVAYALQEFNLPQALS